MLQWIGFKGNMGGNHGILCWTVEVSDVDFPFNKFREWLNSWKHKNETEPTNQFHELWIPFIAG